MTDRNDARVASDEDFDVARATFGLGDGNLGVESVVDSATVVMFGIFTTLAFGRIRERINDERLQQITVLLIAVTLAVFTGIRLLVTSRVAHAMWSYSPDMCRLFFQTALRLRTGTLFFLTHFLSSAIIQTWSEAQLRASEAVAVAYALFVGIYFFVLLTRRAYVVSSYAVAVRRFIETGHAK